MSPVSTGTPFARAHVKGLFERSGECCRPRESAVESDFSNRFPRIVDELDRCSFDANALYELIQGFTHHGVEYPMEVEGGETGHTGKTLKREGVVDVRLNVVDDAVDPLDVLVSVLFGSAVSGLRISHVAPQSGLPGDGSYAGTVVCRAAMVVA